MSIRRCQNSQSEKKLGEFILSSNDPPMPSKAVKELNGKRKRDDKQVQSVEYGENLVGEKIKVWWPLDKEYYEGVVESFDYSTKEHMVSYDDGDEERLNLKCEKWELVKKASPPLDSLVPELPIIVSSPQSNVTCVRGYMVKNIIAPMQSIRGCRNSQSEKKVEKCILPSNDPPMPSKAVKEPNGKRKRDDKKLVGELPVIISSPESGVTCVQGYTVKNINAPILESIFKKHGDIAATCVFKTSSARESILEVVCEVVRKIQTNDVTAIISDMEEIESQVSGAEAIRINVAWLRAHLEAIHRRTEAKKKCSLLRKMNANTSLVTIAAEMDLKEILSELTTVQERFEKAKRCVEVLNIVRKKLNDNFLESKAEKDSWAEHLIL